MLKKSDFSKLKKELEKQDKLREQSIQLSRSLTKKSKQAIYMIHRDELKKADALLKEVRKKLPKKQNPLFNPSLEEYAEAKLFLTFVQSGKILPYSSLAVGVENYLGGLSDMTGELARRSVLRGIKKSVKDVQRIRDLVDAIHGQLLTMEFRNGELRRKYDAVKWNLDKIEKVLYDIRVHK